MEHERETTMADKVRVGVTMTGNLAKAFSAESDSTPATNAYLVRLALVAWLRSKGHVELTNEDAKAEWGGSRKDDAPGQQLAEPAL